MTPTERKLNQDLRILGETGPFEAPSHLEQHLIAAFRKQQRRRFAVRWASIGGAVIAIAAGLSVMAIIRPGRTGPAPVSLAQPFPSVPETAGFVPLPDSDTDGPLEYATIVRVQLPLYALRDIGLAVGEQNATDRVQADVLLGQDGLARAVRFVQ